MRIAWWWTGSPLENAIKGSSSKSGPNSFQTEGAFDGMIVCRLLVLKLLILVMILQRSSPLQPPSPLPPSRNGFNADAFDQFHKRYLLPATRSNVGNCSLSVCEALRIVSQLVLLTKSSMNSLAHGLRKEQHHPDLLDHSDTSSLLQRIETESSGGGQLLKMVRQIESRLRAVEQSVWRLAPASPTEWSHCTSGVCRCNPNTKSFTCWDAHLQTLPATQVIPMNMISIDLSRNALSTLHKDSFGGLTLLQELDLSHNRLDFVPFDLFRDLESLIQLRLQNNRLEELDERLFWKLRNLHLLDLSKNRLAGVHEHLFRHAQRLTVINLCDNQIETFPTDLVRDLLMLEELDMSHNRLRSLRAGSMPHLEKLTVLDFSWNAIATISDDFFSGLRSLQTLSLHNNRLTTITHALFGGLSHLVTLDLTANRISQVDGGFSELISLRELFLGQNALSHLPDALFSNLISLTRLTLFSNNLTSLAAGAFRGLTNLKHLMLNNNILKHLDDHALAPLKNLEKLRIDSNKLQYLPHGCLSGLDRMVAIKLDKNPWHCDCRALYLARWIRQHTAKLWDGLPLCRGPGNLGGQEVGLLRYDDLCDGQWASMVSLSPRLPVRKNRISTPLNYTDYFNLYLKHVYTSSPAEADVGEVGLSTTPSNR